MAAVINKIIRNRNFWRRRRNRYRQRVGFGDLSPEDIVSRYRFDQATIMAIVDLVERDLSADNMRGQPIDALNQVIFTP